MFDKDDDNVSPLRLAAIQAHELYTELKNAGFTRSEAMELLARTFAGSVNDSGND